MASAWSSAFEEITRGVADPHQVVRVTLRLFAAIIVGVAIGLQRELTHKPAGLRTHMMVALGTGLFTVGAVESGMAAGDLSRIVQGIATGIGFLGGGAILKLTGEREIHGLTTAAGIWMTAAASAEAGLGQIAVAMIGVCFGLIILCGFHGLEKSLGHRARKDAEDHNHVDPQSPDLM